MQSLNVDHIHYLFDYYYMKGSGLIIRAYTQKVAMHTTGFGTIANVEVSRWRQLRFVATLGAYVCACVHHNMRNSWTHAITWNLKCQLPCTVDGKN